MLLLKPSNHAVTYQLQARTMIFTTASLTSENLDQPREHDFSASKLLFDLSIKKRFAVFIILSISYGYIVILSICIGMRQALDGSYIRTACTEAYNTFTS